MGFDIANGFATDVFIGDYVMNVEPVIEELMQDLTRFSNKIISKVWELVGRQELDAYSLVFMPPIQSAIDEYKKAHANPAQPQIGQPIPQPA